MRIIILAIVLFIASPAFGAINAILPLESAPAYDACDGTYEECATITVCQINFYVYPVIVWGSTVIITPCQINFYADTVSVSHVTNGIDAILPIESAPEHDACDGAYIECSGITECQINFYADPLTVSGVVTYMTISPCQINFYSIVLGNQRQWAHGRSWAQGRSWAGNPKAIRWTGNPKAVVLVP